MQVAEIRRLFATGEWSADALAERFGVTHCPVQNILHGRSWKASYVPLDVAAIIKARRVARVRTMPRDPTTGRLVKQSDVAQAMEAR